MEDTNEFFAGVLGVLSPWSVSHVERDEEAGKVVVEVVFDRSKAEDVEGHLHGYVDRIWRHLDTCQYQTFIRARVPRFKRADGTTSEVSVPWADRFSRVTRMMEAHAIEVIKASRSHTSAAKLLRLGPGQLDRIMERAVGRGMARRESLALPHVGMDEKAMRRGHRYVSVLTDIERGRVLDLVEGRKKEDAGRLWKTLSENQLKTIEAVAVDMWPAYLNSAGIHVPDADVVHDRFHVAKYLGEAVDAVRKLEHRRLLAVGDTTLTGTKYGWLRRWDDLRVSSASGFRAVYKLALETAKAWRYKESFDAFWAYSSEAWAKKFFDGWYRSVVHTKLTPMKKVAKTLKRHLPGLLAYTRHRITNATAEGLNSKIQNLRTNARGLPKFETFRIRVLFHCGKLDLSPHTV